MMQSQQQTVVTGSAPVQPVYVSQPYQTASVSSTYGHRQSSIIGILLVISGCLTIILSVIDIVIVNQYPTYYSVHVANGAACIVSGVMVSNLKLIHRGLKRELNISRITQSKMNRLIIFCQFLHMTS